MAYATDTINQIVQAVKFVPVSMINPPHQVEKEDKMIKLSENMKKNGWVGRPLLVVENNGIFEAFTGSHRYAAAKRAGLKSIPIYVANRTQLDAKGLTQSLIEGNLAVGLTFNEAEDVLASYLLSQEVMALKYWEECTINSQKGI